MIPLFKSKDIEVTKSETNLIKLKFNPTDTTLKLHNAVMHVFDYGTPEEWLCHRIMINKIITRYNIILSQDKF